MKKQTEYEKSCADLDFKPLTLADFDRFPEEDRVSIFGYHKLTMCLRSRNKDKATGNKWIVNWFDGTRKWWNWFWVTKDESKPSGVGFSFDGSGCVGSGTGVGSRLQSKTEEIAMEAAKNIEITEYYNEFLR